MSAYSSLFPSRSTARALAIGMLYFVGSAAAIRFTRFGGGPACLWVATAILIAELGLRRRRDWPLPVACAAIGGSFASAIFGVGMLAAPLLTAFTVGEGVLAALLIKRWSGERQGLGTLRTVIVFVVAGGILAPALSGLGGAVVISALTPTHFLSNWVSWYVGHALGNITLTPIAFLALSGEMFRGIAALRWPRRLEGGVLMALTATVTWVVFGQTHYPLLFLPLLPLMIAAFRFHRLGGAVAIVLLAAVGTILTLAGNGPVHMIQGGANERALFLEFYLAVAVVMTLLVSAELNQRKALVVALRESEARYRLLTDESSDVILNLTVDGRIAYISPSIREVGGYDPAAVHGQNASIFVHPDDRAAVARAHRTAVRNPGTTMKVEYRGITASGAILWCETHTRGITDETGHVVGAVSAVRDMSAHKQVEAALAHAAQTDPLTGVVNRRAFDTALDQRIADVSAGRGSGVCAILDLDFFKQVNDRHGHGVGDQVLCAFADLVRRSLRGGDLIARLGGEEFAVILWGADLTEAHQVCERLRREVADLAVATGAGDTVRFTFSGGLAPITAGHAAEAIMREADAALYRAKNAGRNRLELAG